MKPAHEVKAMIKARYRYEAELARELGWHRQKLNKITTGAKEPNLHEVAAIAGKLEITLDEAAQFFLTQ